MTSNSFPNIITDCGKYEILLITKDTLQAAISVIQQAFFADENVSIATCVPENQQAIEELSELCIRAAQDGISFIAIERETSIPVSAFINKLQVPPASPDEENYFETFAARCKHPSSRGLMHYMIEMEKKYDVFTERGVRCTLEVMFIGTLRAYRGQQIGRRMWAASMEIGRQLAHGKDARVPVTNVLPPLTRPDCVTALATSNATAQIAKKFGFEVLLEVPFDQFHFNGKAFSERIGPETKSSKLVLKMLK